MQYLPNLYDMYHWTPCDCQVAEGLKAALRAAAKTAGCATVQEHAVLTALNCETKAAESAVK